MGRVLNTVKELRQWIVTILVAVIIASIIWQIKSCQIQKYENENKQLKKEIEDLKNLPPVEVVREVIKEKKIKVCIDKNTNQEIPCNAGTGNPVTIEITKEMCCRLGLGTEFSNKYIRCLDRNICITGDESIEWTEDGKKKFEGIEKLIEDKKSLFDLSFISGYEFVKPGFLIGLNILEHKNIIGGIDINLDTKKFNNSDVGVYTGYRPRFFKKWRFNFAGIIGAGTSFNNIGKEWHIQVGLIFYLMERK